MVMGRGISVDRFAAVNCHFPTPLFTTTNARWQQPDPYQARRLFRRYCIHDAKRVEGTCYHYSSSEASNCPGIRPTAPSSPRPPPTSPLPPLLNVVLA